MRTFISYFVLLLLLSERCLAEPSTLEHLKIFLTGTFTSAEQARGDRNFRDVTLHVAPIWPDRTDGPWLYVEQALTDAPAHPYRQRVYQLAARPDGALESRVFELLDPIGLTGAWQNPTRFERLEPATSLNARAGCTVVLYWQSDGTFKGGTEGQGCTSTMQGASYATSEASIGPTELITWDRGYNAAGIQVWGSLHGGYVFNRIE
jgi:hypothetical protein